MEAEIEVSRTRWILLIAGLVVGAVSVGFVIGWTIDTLLFE